LTAFAFRGRRGRKKGKEEAVVIGGACAKSEPKKGNDVPLRPKKRFRIFTKKKKKKKPHARQFVNLAKGATTKLGGKGSASASGPGLLEGGKRNARRLRSGEGEGEKETISRRTGYITGPVGWRLGGRRKKKEKRARFFPGFAWGGGGEKREERRLFLLSLRSFAHHGKKRKEKVSYWQHMWDKEQERGKINDLVRSCNVRTQAGKKKGVKAML